MMMPEQHMAREALPVPAAPAAERAPSGLEGLSQPGISEQDLVELRVIAQTVGGDFGMSVRLGVAGGGSYFNPVTRDITLDPDHVSRDPSLAKFVTGHEGAHCRYTTSPYDLGRSRSEIDGMYSRLGFAATDNVIEDQAINDSMVRQFPGMAAHTTHAYDQLGPREGGILAHPEILSWVRAHGYVPKFSTVLSALLGDWVAWRRECGYKERYADVARHARYHEKLTGDVKRCAELILASSRVAASETVPAGCLDREQIRAARMRRLDIIDRHVYPEIAKLMQADVKNEALRQDLSRNERAGTLSERTKQEIEKALQRSYADQAAEMMKGLREAAADSAGQDEREGEILRDLEREAGGRSGGEPDPGRESESGGGEPGSREELERARAKRREAEERRDAGLKSLSDLDPALPEKARDVLAKEQAGKEGADQAARTEPEPPRKKSLWERIFGRKPEKKEPPPPDPGEELEREISEALRKRDEERGAKPLPIDDLPPEAISELRRAFDRLPQAEKEEILDAARRELEKLDDEIAKALRSKLAPEQPLSHSDRREAEDRASREGEIVRQIHASRESLEEKLKAVAGRQRTEFRASFERMSDQIEIAANRLRRVFLPEEIFRWERDRPFGERVDMRKAMAAKRTPELRAEMFMKRIEPTRCADAIEVLVDVTGSMKNGNKARSTLDAAVFISELAERLKIKCEVLIFNTKVEVLKTADESIADTAVQSRFGRILKPNGNNDDALAVRTGYKRLLDIKARNRFLLILSDAEVCTPDALKEAVSRVTSERRAIMCHFGIGEGTTDRGSFYPVSFGGLPIEISTAQRARGMKSFLDVFCEETERMVLQPERFLSRR